MNIAPVNASEIPGSVETLDRWVLWRLEQRPDKDGKLKDTKVLYNVRTGRRALSTDPKTWATFAVTLTAYEAGGWDGIGFVFNGDGVLGIDLDKCRNPDTGEIEPWALEIIRAADSYTESSVSGTGVHIILRGKLPAKGRRFGRVEMYEVGRFFTMTGNRIAGTPREVNDRADVVTALHAQLALDYELEKQLKKHTKLHALWQGDISGYESQSQADLALCGYLARISRDRPQIERLFRRSGLYRDKWERQDYRDSTIEKALDSKGDYRPGILLKGGLPLGTRPDERWMFTDFGNAQRLVARHGRDLRYCNQWRRWLTWDGRRWAIDDTGEIVRRAKDTVRAIYAEAAAFTDPEERKACASHATRSESEARIRAMIELAKSEPGIPIVAAQLDTHPWLLNCENGTIDLRTGNLRMHDRDDLITKLAPVAFDAAATCPAWDALLRRIMGNKQQVISFLQRAIGYSATGIVSERVLFMLYGTGANGKTTMLEAMRALFGDYAMRTPTETLLAKRDDGIPSDIARLKGARFVYSSEGEDGRRLAEAKVKDLTGGDTISARFMHADWFEFQPEFKLWLGTNYKPVIRGTDLGIWDRIKLIPFTVRIEGSEQKPRHVILEDLRNEGAGILAWVVRGCLEWQRSGLGVPTEVIEATADYRAQMDVIGDFISDRCVIGSEKRVKAGEIYSAYVAWCEASGEKPLSQKVFGSKLQERGFVPDRTGTARWWVGLGLMTQTACDVMTRSDVRNQVSHTIFSHERETPFLASPSVIASPEQNGHASNGHASSSRTPLPQVLILTNEWQEVPDGVAVPPGADIRMDMASGKNFARLLPSTGDIDHDRRRQEDIDKALAVGNVKAARKAAGQIRGRKTRDQADLKIDEYEAAHKAGEVAS